MAVAERGQEGRDLVGIYDLTKTNFECLVHFQPETFDLQDLEFSGDGEHLITWDSHLKCKLLVYKIKFSSTGIEQVEPAEKFSPYENTSLGIRNVKLSANRQYILAGFFD
jgi:hypothetical protein